MSDPRASHGPGFKSVEWFGRHYAFNAQQAACIGVLWRAWLGGTPVIREEMVLEVAHIQARCLKDVFRSHPGRDAWGTLIANGDKRGTVRLAEPAPSSSATASSS